MKIMGIRIISERYDLEVSLGFMLVSDNADRETVSAKLTPLLDKFAEWYIDENRLNISTDEFAKNADVHIDVMHSDSLAFLKHSLAVYKEEGGLNDNELLEFIKSILPSIADKNNSNFVSATLH